ncbi:DUF4231 domain-containing protein [Mycoplasma sp. 5370]
MEIEKKYKKIYNILFSKVFVLRFLFFTLTFVTFILVFLSSMLTAYFLAGVGERFRPVLPEQFTNSEFRNNYAIIIAWLSASGSFITSIISFFAMQAKYKKNKKALTTIKLEKALYDANLGLYKKNKHKGEIFLKRLFLILKWNYLDRESDVSSETILASQTHKKYVLKNLENMEEKELLQLVNKTRNKYKRKFIISYYLFLLLNILVIVMTSLMIVFNLYSLRFNQFPDIKGTEKSIYYLLEITLASALTTLLTSISSFFAFGEKREKINSDIKELEKKLEEFKTVPIENLNEWIESISNYGELL